MITVIFTILVQTILNMFLKGSVEIASTILSVLNDLFIPQDSENYNALGELIGIVQSDSGTWGGFDIAGFLYAMTYAVLFLLFFLEFYRHIAANLTGQNSESALSMIGRILIVGILLFLFYGNGSEAFIGKDEFLLNSGDNNVTLLGKMNSLFLFPLQTIMPRVNELMETASSGITGISLPTIDVVNYVGLIVVSGGLLASIISGAISILERTITIIIYLLLGPIAIAFYVSKVTAQATIEWLKGLIIQYLVLDVSIIVWGLAIGKLQQFFNKIFAQSLLDAIGDAFNSADYRQGIMYGAVAIVLFSISGNTEEIFGSLGFKMMSGLDSARIIGGGLNTAMSAIRTASMASSALAPAGKKISEATGKIAGKVAAPVLSEFPQTASIADKLSGSPQGTALKKALENKAVIHPERNGDGKACVPGKTPTKSNAKNFAFNAMEDSLQNGGAPNGGMDDDKYREAVKGISETTLSGKPCMMQRKLDSDEISQNGGETYKTVAASDTMAAFAKVADQSDNYLTKTEKAAKEAAVQDMFDSTKPGMTAIGYFDNNGTTVAHTIGIGELADGQGLAVFNGGSSMENLKSIALPVEDGKVQKIPVSTNDVGDFVTAKNGDTPQEYSFGRASLNDPCITGLTKTSVMKVSFNTDQKIVWDSNKIQRYDSVTPNMNNAAAAVKKVKHNGK